MEKPRNPKRFADAAITGNGVEPSLLVEFEILAGVEYIEACAPEGDSSSQQQDARIERAAHRDPCSRWRDSHGESQNQMRPASEALGIRVKQNYGQRERRQNK